MENGPLNWIANFIWGIADDVLRDVYVRGKGPTPNLRPRNWIS
jgi:type I restriction enzyme M protein